MSSAIDYGFAVYDGSSTGKSFGDAITGGRSVRDLLALGAGVLAGYETANFCSGLAAIPAALTGIESGGTTVAATAVICGSLSVAAGTFVEDVAKGQ